MSMYAVLLLCVLKVLENNSGPWKSLKSPWI